jgi:outer membrane protein assembly factor BamB
MHNEDQILSIAGDVVQAFRFETGQRLWSIASQGEGLVPSPVMAMDSSLPRPVSKKTTLRGHPSGRHRENGACPRSSGNSARVSPRMPRSSMPAPISSRSRTAGSRRVFNPANGDILWQERVGGNYSASPVVAEGRIYFLNEAGETTVIAAAPEFKVLAKNASGKMPGEHGGLGGRPVLLRTDKKSLLHRAQTP